MGSLPSQTIVVDALVIGAGMGGIYSTYKLSCAGLNVRCIDTALDVGGTWYWNRYPGAMSDTESYLYRYSWDKDELQTYPWTHRYVYQPEILAYLRHMTAKYDLRRHMTFETSMESAKWDETSSSWIVQCRSGGGATTLTFRTRHLVNCLGLLNKPNYPQIDGLASFAGQTIHTARWDNSVVLEGKRVGVIGNGSTGVQVMTAVAPIVGQLKSFQRHPQYSVPSGQGPVSREYREKINADYDGIWERALASKTGFGIHESQRKTMDASPEEQRRAFQEVWDQGNGFRFMFGAFGDLTEDLAANEAACAFIKSKIDDIVKDARKAAALKPNELYARRPLCDSGYYQIFNQDNVDIVDLRATPIHRIVPEGIVTRSLTDGQEELHELDVLVFATGFDAIEGSYMRVQIRGCQGLSLQDHWTSGPKSYGGIACHGFPNMFMVAGPQGPFSNFPPIIESEVDFITACILHADKHPKRRLEASEEAETGWGETCVESCEGSLFKSAASWLFSTNIPGRKPIVKFYFGGLGKYREWVKDTELSGFRGFICA